MLRRLEARLRQQRGDESRTCCFVTWRIGGVELDQAPGELDCVGLIHLTFP
jgi:hypothetical protein